MVITGNIYKIQKTFLISHTLPKIIFTFLCYIRIFSLSLTYMSTLNITYSWDKTRRKISAGCYRFVISYESIIHEHQFFFLLIVIEIIMEKITTFYCILYLRKGKNKTKLE